MIQEYLEQEPNCVYSGCDKLLSFGSEVVKTLKGEYACGKSCVQKHWVSDLFEGKVKEDAFVIQVAVETSRTVELVRRETESLVEKISEE